MKMGHRVPVIRASCPVIWGKLAGLTGRYALQLRTGFIRGRFAAQDSSDINHCLFIIPARQPTIDRALMDEGSSGRGHYGR